MTQPTLTWSLSLALAMMLGLASVSTAHSEKAKVEVPNLKMSLEAERSGKRISPGQHSAPLGPDHLQKKHLGTIKHEPFASEPARSRSQRRAAPN
jgi:hypothetical protein